jgi:hypothetical protein
MGDLQHRHTTAYRLMSRPHRGQGLVTTRRRAGFGAGGGLGIAAIPTVADLATTGSAIGGATAPSVWSKILRGATGTGGNMGAYDWLGPAVSASLNLVGTEKQVNASEAAAQKQLEATKYAADAQAKAAAESLAFQRQQAAYDATVAESTRGANYQQWAAKQQQLGSVGQALGLPARAIPAYVPLPPSGLGGGATPAAQGAPYSPQGAPTGGASNMIVSGDQLIDPAMFTGGGKGGMPAGQTGGGDTSWWNPQDARGSVERLLAGKAPTSQTILALKPQFDAAGIQISPANAEGVTSKIFIPGVGWTRVLDGGVAGGPGGGQGTGWTYVPQGGGGAVPTQGRQGQPAYGQTDALGSVQQYFLDPTQATGQLTLPRYRPLGAGAVGSYL